MFRIIVSILALPPLFILYLVIRSYYKAWQYERRSATMGCKPPIKRPFKYPGGIDGIMWAFDADKKHQLPNMLENISFNQMKGYKTFIQYFFGDLGYFTYDPVNIQTLLANKFDDFEIGSIRRGSFFPLLGNGIFTADGKDWAHGRALLRPQFARNQVADLDMEEAHVQDMFKHLKVSNDGWTDSINLQPLFFRFTMDTSTEFLFGESVHSQICALPEDAPERQNFKSATGLDMLEVGRAYDRAIHDIGTRSRFVEFYFLYNPKSFRDDCELVHKFADYYVNQALSLNLEKEPSSSNSKYVFLHELTKSTRDPIELRSQLLNIFLAGRDTTAGLLGFTFWILSRHPSIFHKLRTTIISEFGTYRNPRNITFSTLKGCTYLQHVLSEVLRLYPSVPINSRRAVRDTTIPHGGGPDGKSPVFVPKGTQVDYSVHVMHRCADFWGVDAETFNPDRWIGRKAGWEFLPFNGGPRICLGQQFALTEAGYVTVRMLQRFDGLEIVDQAMTYRDGTEVDESLGGRRYQYTVTTAPWEVNVRLREAKDL